MRIAPTMRITQTESPGVRSPLHARENVAVHRCRITEHKDARRQTRTPEAQRAGITRAELVEEAFRALETTRSEAKVVVDTVFNCIGRVSRRNEKVAVRGFGSFRTRQRGARTGGNPKTGVAVDVPAKRIPYFKPSKELEELLSGS
jgi:integration host factor subunit beta